MPFAVGDKRQELLAALSSADSIVWGGRGRDGGPAAAAAADDDDADAMCSQELSQDTDTGTKHPSESQP